MSEIELKACPFCGGRPKHASTDGAGYWQQSAIHPPQPGRRFVICDHCGVETDTYKTPTSAAEAWNRRVG